MATWKPCAPAGSMILVDSSAWIEFLRGTGSPACVGVRRALDGPIATCDAIRMEILAGARNEQHLTQLRGLLARAVIIPTEPGDFDSAAALYRQCRVAGESVRKMMDCLIGAAAIKASIPILHNDSDFDVLARHTSAQVMTPCLKG